MVSDEMAVRLVDRTSGITVAYQLTAGRVQDGPGGVSLSAAAISARECMVNAGVIFKDGKSRTANLSEEQRKEREKRTHPKSLKYLDAEDHIERTVEKVKLWKHPLGKLDEMLKTTRKDKLRPVKKNAPGRCASS